MAKSIEQKSGKEGSLFETVKTIIYAVLIALIIRSFAFEPFDGIAIRTRALRKSKGPECFASGPLFCSIIINLNLSPTAIRTRARVINNVFEELRSVQYLEPRWLR